MNKPGDNSGKRDIKRNFDSKTSSASFTGSIRNYNRVTSTEGIENDRSNITNIREQCRNYLTNNVN